MQELVARGLFTRILGDIICLSAPLVISNEQIDRSVTIIGEAVAASVPVG